MVQLHRIYGGWPPKNMKPMDLTDSMAFFKAIGQTNTAAELKIIADGHIAKRAVKTDRTSTKGEYWPCYPWLSGI